MNFYPKAFKIFRESRGFTHADIAQKLGIQKQSIEHWEAGRAKPRACRVYAIAKILGCSVVDISDLKSEKDLEDSFRMSQESIGNGASISSGDVVPINGGVGNRVNIAKDHSVLIGNAKRVFNHVPEYKDSENVDAIRQDFLAILLDSDEIPAEIKTKIVQIYFAHYGANKTR